MIAVAYATSRRARARATAPTARNGLLHRTREHASRMRRDAAPSVMSQSVIHASAASMTSRCAMKPSRIKRKAGGAQSTSRMWARLAASVYLGGGDVGVAEDLPDNAQSAPPSSRVAKEWRSMQDQVLPRPRGASGIGDDAGVTLWRVRRPPAGVQEQPPPWAWRRPASARACSRYAQRLERSARDGADAPFALLHDAQKSSSRWSAIAQIEPRGSPMATRSRTAPPGWRGCASDGIMSPVQAASMVDYLIQ